MTLLFLLSSLAAHASRYWEPDALVADAFPGADTHTVQLDLSPADQADLRRQLGRPVPKDAYSFIEADKDGHVEGYLLFDEQKGQHEPITFAVVLSPDAVVLRQEVVVYRERYGDGVANPRFRAQFIGKSSVDALKPGKDVDIVSGATISSVAMTVGVKRAIALTELLVARGDTGGQ